MSKRLSDSTHDQGARMKPYYDDNMVTVYPGDCLAVMGTLPDESIDAVVCDPPYGLSNTDPKHVAETLTRWVTGDHEYTPPAKGGFMGKTWDSFVPPPAVWIECMRVLKPGGHLLAFAGTRTQDLMGLSVRLAGFEIRDGIGWIYGSGFPKSMDVSKAIDKAAGAEREVVRSKLTRIPGEATYVQDTWTQEHRAISEVPITAPAAAPEAERWSGWGTALKPAIEPVIMARKPIKGTVAVNVLEHGTGGINVDACRIPTTDKLSGGHASGGQQMDQGWHRPWMDDPEKVAENAARSRESVARSEKLGRWPANVLLDPEAAAAMDEQSGVLKSGGGNKAPKKSSWFTSNSDAVEDMRNPSEGGASRFFPVFKYQAKASKKERPVIEREDGTKVAHPTVKPLALMEWLVTLVTPPGGVVLDPFAGSGTTLQAARDKGFRSIGIEADADYVELIRERLDLGSGDLG